MGRAYSWNAILLLACSLNAIGANPTVPEMRPEMRLPGNIDVADWRAIRQEYERHRRGMFAENGEYVARSYSQQWLARFDRVGFEIRPDKGDWRWGLDLLRYGFPGKLRELSGPAAASTDVE